MNDYDVLYSESQYWIERISDLLIVGLTDEAQEELAEILYVKLPEVDKVYNMGEPCGLIESSRLEDDIYAPVTGRVIEINTELESNPGLINEFPRDDGWLFKISPLDLSELDRLMTEQQYRESLDS